jgi:hypothetical protein
LIDGKQKNIGNFLKLLDYSSNQMKKKSQNNEKITLNIFKKVTSLHIKKINEENTFLALSNSKIKIFSKFKKQVMI